MPGEFPTGRRGWTGFQSMLMKRIDRLFQEQLEKGLNDENGLLRNFSMPCGIFLVIDEDNGGDSTAKEIIKRFNLLHEESGNVIDFYLLGWKWTEKGNRSKGITFDLKSFNSCRNILKEQGIRSFGGNADLILVDVHRHFRQLKGYEPGVGGLEYILDFQNAIHINLSSRTKAKDIPDIGEFLQSIVAAAEEVKSDVKSRKTKRVIYSISDKLGLAIAKRSILDFFYKKWGGIFGAKKLDVVAIRNIGPKVSLLKLELDGIAAQDE
jgi:hypothetical protein